MEMPLPPLATLAPPEQAPAPVVDEAKDAYELLQSVYRNPALPIGMRMRAAIEALPFEKPKLAVTAIVEGGEAFAARLERAIARSGKLLELEANPAPESALRRGA
jgi:hypothetical protein